MVSPNDPCDGEDHQYRSACSKNQYQLHLYWRLVKGKCPGVPVPPDSANCFVDWKNKTKERSTFAASNWPLTLMSATSRENRRCVCEVMMLHEAAVSSSSAGLSVLGLRRTAGLDLCRWQGRFSPAQHTVGILWRDSLSIYLTPPLPSVHFRVFKEVKSIDQHLKLSPTSCPSSQDIVTSPLSSHYTPSSPPVLTLWYNYD